MGNLPWRPRKYTGETLARAVPKYFDSISRTVPVLDADGSPVMDAAGAPMTRIDYPVPPTVGGLCRFLGITYQTWEDYCKKPEYRDTTTKAQALLREYLVTELLTREGKDTRGPQFVLQASYGMSPTDKKEIDLGPTAAKVATAALSVDDRERMLREIAEEFGGEAD